MDQSQKAIIEEIKFLEDKVKKGNKPKTKNALLVAGGVAAVGGIVAGAVSLAFAPETLIAAIPYSPLIQWSAGNLGLSLMAGGAGYFFTNGEKEAKVALNKGFTRRIDEQFKLLKDPRAGSKIDFTFNIDSSVYPEYQKKTQEQVHTDTKKDAIDLTPTFRTPC